MKNISLFALLTLSVIFNFVHAGDITRSQFTSSIVDREPVDTLVSVPEELQKVFYFTELQQFQGEKMTHQWMHEGQEMYRISFDVKGPRWRVWSSKRLVPRWNGTWTVNILDANNKALHSDSFVYLP